MKRKYKRCVLINRSELNNDLNMLYKEEKKKWEIRTPCKILFNSSNSRLL